ncbi:MAG: metal ABC transporter ATP-binding protein [Lachnospiraceae bacterium]|nr:metal ABC transporter ATP-binding protein [Lachnospiraceae bacterium]
MKEKKCLISCENAGLGYDNKAIIENFNFSVYGGDYICVIGENGSGKSTLIKTLLGLIKPVSGKVTLSDALKEGAIGYLPQQTQVQKHFPASVMEVVMSGFLNDMRKRPFYKKEEKMAAVKNLEKLEIADLKAKCYGELSGGQQQRVLLARALCAADEILVLDEPVTGLDPAAAASLYDILQKLHEEGMAIVMVTHDLKSIVGRTEKILHINEGGYFFGTVEEYRKSDYSKIFSEK